MKTVFTLVIASVITFSLSAQQTEIRYLSGTGNNNTVDWDFFVSDGMNSNEWTTIAVPSCWEQQGFGAYNYGHDLMDQRHHEFGLYKHRFLAPKNWKGKEVNIVFEGVMTDAEVKINGTLAGEIHQGAFYEFHYAISKLLNYGEENLLEVKVHKVSANTSINYAERQADFWIFGGIFRPVYLEILPKNHIKRLAVDAKASGLIDADVFIKSRKAEKIALVLYDLSGNKLQNLKLTKLKKEEYKWHITAQAKDILTWNPESPNMYVLKIKLLNNKSETLHELEQRIGFRTVELLKGDGIYVNGQRIKFKGVNRHSFHPASGRTTSKALSIEHVKMMKDMNMNAVRMSHYPPDVHFLDVCDSLGLFVIDEVCTWHSPHLDTEVGQKIVKETVVRDVNHPSILLWANGNETGWNTELDDDYALWDIQQREVIHPWNIFRKTNTLHYFNYHALANDAYSKDKILFPTEFLHGLYDGGHGAGLEDYWKLMWQLPTCAGGFLWNFADEAIERSDKNGMLDTDGNHAADGIVGPYGEKEASYYTIKEIWSPIYIEDRYIREDFNGIFRVENRYHYTNLDKCTMQVKWLKFNGPEETLKESTIWEHKIKLPPLSPGSKGSFKILKPSNWQSADALHLTATDMHGNEVFTWSYPVKLPKQLNAQITNQTDKNPIKTSIVGTNIQVVCGNNSYVFSKENGLIQEVKKGNTTIPLKNGPIFLGQKDKIDSVYISETDDNTEIFCVFEKSLKSPAWASEKKYASDTLKWTIYPNGLVRLSVQLTGKRIVKDYKGVTFSFPETEVEGMKWLGDGPYRVWRNRMKGTRFQVWENDYNNTVTGESGFVYPEFKGFFSSLYWARVKGKNNNGFTVYCHSPHTYLRMLTPKNPIGDQKGRVSPKFPAGDISFVKNIPAIGTKFQTSDTMGPHGNSENYFGNDDEPIVLDLTFKF